MYYSICKQQVFEIQKHSNSIQKQEFIRKNSNNVLEVKNDSGAMMV